MIRRTSYTGKGRKNKSINMEFIELCKMDKESLKVYLQHELRKYYMNVVSRDGFLYAKGKHKVLLTAHMDTVHKELIKSFNEYIEDGKHIVSSPQGIGGDDRCGIYIILKILKTTKLRPTILFCEDEEIGCIGSQKFNKSNFAKKIQKMYFMIQLDRRGSSDAVFYDDENTEFHRYVERITDYYEAWGTCSDISYLAPKAKVSAVNLSCGYYNEHTTDEYVVLEEMEETVKATKKLIHDAIINKKQYEYVEAESYISNYNYGFGRDYGYGYNYSNYNYLRYMQEQDSISTYLWVNFEGAESGEDIISAQDANEDEMFGLFFREHTNISWNEILDYQYYTEDDLIREAEKEEKKA